MCLLPMHLYVTVLTSMWLSEWEPVSHLGDGVWEPVQLHAQFGMPETVKKPDWKLWLNIINWKCGQYPLPQGNRKLLKLSVDH